MKSKSNEFLGGAALLLTYHLYILTWIGITFLISNFKAFQAFRFTGQTVHPAHGFVLLLIATPILYFLIRRFSKRTVYRILTAHVLIAVLVPFFIEYEFVAGLYIFAPYLAIIPVYLILYRKRTALFAWGALIVHIVLALLCLIIGQSTSHAISEWMIAQNGDDWAIITLLFDLIARSIIGLVAPITHLVICLIRRLFPSKITA